MFRMIKLSFLIIKLKMFKIIKNKLIYNLMKIVKLVKQTRSKMIVCKNKIMKNN